MFLEGNPLEISPASSIVDATNHCPRLFENSPDKKQSQFFSVKGTNGSDFLACLFENIFRNQIYKKVDEVQIIYKSCEIFNLEKFLKGFSIEWPIEIFAFTTNIVESHYVCCECKNINLRINSTILIILRE